MFFFFFFNLQMSLMFSVNTMTVITPGGGFFVSPTKETAKRPARLTYQPASQKRARARVVPNPALAASKGWITFRVVLLSSITKFKKQ